MDYKKSLIEFKNWVKHGYAHNTYMPSSFAINTAVAALEKQIPKKPYAETAFYGTCPSCSRTIDTDYCEYCGQAIDWSEVE